MNITKAALDHRRMGDYYRRLGQWRKANREYERADALDTAKVIRREVANERRPISKTHRDLLESLKKEGII